MSGMATFTLTQTKFRFYEDGTDTGSTAIAAVNTNITRSTSSPKLHLRVELTESGGASGASTDDYQLQVSKNGGGYANVTTSSSNVKAFDSTSLTNGATTPTRVTDAFGQIGVISEDGLADDFLINFSTYTDILYTVELVPADLANNDTLDFRVLRNGATFTYNVTPRITVSKPVTLNALTGSLSVNENSANGSVVGTPTGYTSGSTKSLTDNAGGRFTINSSTGQITVADGSLLDYETNTSHNVTVRETLTGATNTPRDTVLSIAINNISAPSATDWTPAGTPVISANAPIGTTVGALNKPLSSVVTLIGGTNSNQFEIYDTSSEEGVVWGVRTVTSPLTVGTSSLQIRDTTNGPAGSGEDRTDTLNITVGEPPASSPWGFAYILGAA